MLKLKIYGYIYPIYVSSYSNNQTPQTKMEQFATLCKETKIAEAKQWIKENGVDHKMISVCWHLPTMVEYLLELGISLHEDVTWTTGLLDHPESVRIICMARKESMQSLAAHHDLITRCKNPKVLNTLVITGGVNINTKYSRPGMPPMSVAKHNPSYYVTDPDLLFEFYKLGATDFDYTSIVNDVELLKIFLNGPNKTFIEKLGEYVYKCTDIPAATELLKVKFSVVPPLDTCKRITDPVVIEMLPPKYKEAHPMYIAKKKEQMAYYDAVKSNKLENVKAVTSGDIEYYGEGGTPLGLAVINRNIEIARHLLEQKADPNSLAAAKIPGCTPPLHKAIEGLDFQMIRLLLTFNARTTLRVNGRDAMNYATAKNTKARAFIIDELLKMYYISEMNSLYNSANK